MTENLHDLGDLVRCDGTFTNSSTGAPLDPSVVTFTFRKPDGTLVSYTHGTDAELVKDGTGLYHVDLNANQVGRWTYRFAATGTGQSAEEHDFVVVASTVVSPLGSELTTLGAVRAFLQKPTAETEQDSIIQSLITRASQAIMRYTGREFAPATASAAREFEYDGSGWLELTPYDLRTVSQVRIDSDEASPTTLTSTQYRLAPYPPLNGVFTALRIAPQLSGSGRWRHRRLEVTGAWGFGSVPSDVEHWCIVTTALWLRREVSAFSTTFKIDEDRLERPEALPSAVRAGLGHYKRYPRC